MSSKVALVGAGVIGGGWAGRLVECGAEVVVYDPAANAEARVHELVANAERTWKELVRAPRTRGTLSFAPTLAEAVAGADVVQESAPEDEALKRRLLAEIDAAAPADALVCSSTSGLRPTRLQADLERPERFVVGHPFNPVYLLPLVEVCGGERTSPETIERACAFYSSLGMHPLLVRAEIDGFVADRLLEALWREALWLVHDGVATTGEVDDAVVYGAGLRWAQMGTFLTYRIAGGEGGMRRFLEQFGPALEWPWTKLVDVPELTDEFLDRLAEQSDAQAGSETVAELERRRDDNLVALLRALRSRDEGAGRVLREHEERLRTEAGAAATPLRLHRARVLESWLDYNGHMTESRYLQVFGDASDAFLRHVGLDAAYLAAGHSLYTVETHLRHLREAALEDELLATTQVLEADAKRLRLFHSLTRGDETSPVATGEHLLLHVDARAGRVSPMQEPVASRVAAVAREHAALPWPEGAGRAVGDPR